MSTLSHEFFAAIEEMKSTPQRLDYHPEKWVWDHEAYVLYGIEHNLELTDRQLDELRLVALFHDIGKIDTTWFREKKDCYVSYGHEKAALPYYDAVEKAVLLGKVRGDVIRWLIKNHMKPKYLDRMNQSTIDSLKKEANELGDDVWDLLIKFNSQDDMRSFFKDTDEEQRVEAKYWFNAFINEILSRIDDYYVDNDYSNGDLFLFRGVPGSGKTSAAKAIVANGGGFEVAADEFFVGDDGKYRYDGSKIGEAHEYCQSKAKEALEAGETPIIVHNTFKKRWEMMKYFQLAEDFNYRVFSMITENRHGNKTIHNVPEHKVDEMRDKMDVSL